MCRCPEFDPLALRPEDIQARVQATAAIKATLALVAARATRDRSAPRLFRCRECGQLWQSGRHAGFGSREYVYQVPEISREAWLSEPYADPAALVAFAAQKRWLAQTRQYGVKPTPPPGRLFFMTPDALDAERARRNCERASVALHEALAARGDAEHLESLRAMD